MKRIIFFSSIVIIAIVAVSVSRKRYVPDVSALTLANIEALASGESSGGQRSICYKKLEGLQGAPMEDKTWCAECKARPATKWSDKSECPN